MEFGLYQYCMRIIYSLGSIIYILKHRHYKSRLAESIKKHIESRHLELSNNSKDPPNPFTPHPKHPPTYSSRKAFQNKKCLQHYNTANRSLEAY